MNTPSNRAVPYESNIKMVSFALWSSIIGLALLIVITLTALFWGDGGSSPFPGAGTLLIVGGTAVMFLLTVSLPMSIAGMIASARRGKAVAAFVMSCLTLSGAAAAIYLLATS